MARSFSSTSDHLRNASAAAVTSAGTVALWIRPTWSSGDSADHLFFEYGTQVGSGLPIFQKYLDNKVYVGFLIGSDQRIVINDTGLFSNGVWGHHILTWDDPANDQRYYVGGVEKGSRTASLTFTPQAGLAIGNHSATYGSVLNAAASIAEFARWTRVLTAAERVLLAAGYSPLAVPTGLADYRDLSGRNSPEPSRLGDGALTVTGTGTTDHPRIFRRALLVHPIIQGPLHTSLAGSAIIAITTTASLTIAPTALAGTATIAITATGTLVATGASLDGTATITVTATGNLTLGGTTLLAGTGTITLTATATGMTSARAALAGRARIVITAAGALKTATSSAVTPLRSQRIQRPFGRLERV